MAALSQIDTERLTLRPLGMHHAAPLSAMFLADVDALRMTGSVPEPATLEAIQAWLSARVSSPAIRLFAVEPAGPGSASGAATVPAATASHAASHAAEPSAGGNFMGFVCLYLEEHEGKPRAEVGYILDRQYRGQGLAVEACRPLLTIAAETGARQVRACIFPGNTASARVAAKLGFKYEGTEEQMLPARGGLRVSEVYVLDLPEADV